MTENEAIIELRKLRPSGGIIPQKRAEMMDVAIQALEENQRYHKLGTVEEIKTRFKNENEAIKSAVEIVVDRNLLIRYQSIGTAEELEAANKYVQLAKKHRTVGKVIDACAEYEEIGTVEEFKALKEKAEPKKPNYEGDGYYNGELVLDTWICPNCGKSYEVDYDNYDYCPNCGQNIDHSSLTEDD